MDTMAIAAMSTALSSAQVMQQANVSILRKSMDMQENQMNSLLQVMQSAPAPSFGHTMDFRV